jgi:DNA-binding XRE family transcriptional regulator
MKNNLCCGFFYETEEELKNLLGIDEYQDMFFGKGPGWISEDLESSETGLLIDSLAMDVFVKRKAEGLSQRELAKRLGIGVETLSRIENGHDNLSRKVKSKIYEYLNDGDYF